MLAYIGLFGSLALLVYLTMKGVNLLISAPLTALLAALTNGLAFFPQTANENQANFLTSYMDGFTGFVGSWYLMFMAGAIFGKVMEDTGAADSVSKWIVEKIGVKYATYAVVLAAAVLTYGGVSVFIVAFSVYPMAISLFKQANFPRRFIPAALGLGSVTFTMTSAGSPEIQNWIPIQYLGTTPYAGWQVSIVVAIFMAVGGSLWLNWMIKRAVNNGEIFIERSTDPVVDETQKLPSPLLSLIPLLVVLVISFAFHNSLGTSALIVAYLVSYKYAKSVGATLAAGAMGAIIAIANTAAVVGFGGVVKATPSFLATVDVMTNIPGSPLIGGALAIAVIAGLTGSASGGQTIAMPLLAPHYIDIGVDTEALHRTIAIASGSLDSLPHGGYVVTTINSVCNEKHKDAYMPFGALTVMIPTIGTIIAIILFSIGM
ncbi:GntP family permease [Lysinibacillus fusiformis]|uniref:GntP family permease n=1 Tax=Lysinibacillus fusiformis TaxID=28031 RepID=UPI000888F668|nr:SLC13 family permease [Lysinibacillus fusiformis]SCX48965.1 H+/gluconate symporter [Lysinibacillus fusiformis]SDB19159.1 H+/gluconate symporter [Lysinibacillus fusiformis]SFI09392.1 H+/gluconate symporter [Lysinibacillus fusiformis]SFS58618.1 H+/gluconate symporter [Lysinibacillus fusiformis]